MFISADSKSLGPQLTGLRKVSAETEKEKETTEGAISTDVISYGGDDVAD